MDRGQQLIQAYKNAPWRRQLQVIGLFSAVVAFIAIIAGVYLNVTARAATFGREIQLYQSDIRQIEQDIEDLEAQLADLTSARFMQQRAEELGFKPVQKGRAIYLKVPGYAGRQTAVLVSDAPTTQPLDAQLPPQYTESLVDWVRRLINAVGAKTGAAEVLP